jgi:hypothetical protein
LSDTDQVTVYVKSPEPHNSNQTRLNLKLSQDVVEVGKPITISGLLSQGNDESREGIGEEQISFTGKGASYPQSIPTQSDGSFRFKVGSPLEVGEWNVQGHTSSESKYGSISSNTVSYRTEPIRIEASDITFQHEANENESLKSEPQEHDLSIPGKEAIMKGCVQNDGRDFNDRLGEIREEGGHLKYDVKDKSIKKIIYYEITFKCKYSILSKLNSAQLSDMLSKVVEFSTSVKPLLEKKGELN